MSMNQSLNSNRAKKHSSLNEIAQPTSEDMCKIYSGRLIFKEMFLLAKAEI